MRPHLSLEVKDVRKSVDFYKRIFAQDPQKQTADYAKFDLQKPAFNFFFHTGKGAVSRVSHLGVEVDSIEELNGWQERLEKAQIEVIPETDTDCCFARQDKIWFKDPDGNPWEIFYVYEQLPTNQPIQSACCAK